MTDYRVRPGEVTEDQLTSRVEGFTSHVPSSLFLAASIASIGWSLISKIQGRDKDALFFGQWVAPFLLLGIYNKMVKQHGSDATQRMSGDM